MSKVKGSFLLFIIIVLISSPIFGMVIIKKSEKSNRSDYDFYLYKSSQIKEKFGVDFSESFINRTDFTKIIRTANTIMLNYDSQSKLTFVRCSVETNPINYFNVILSYHIPHDNQRKPNGQIQLFLFGSDDKSQFSVSGTYSIEDQVLSNENIDQKIYLSSINNNYIQSLLDGRQGIYQIGIGCNGDTWVYPQD